MNFIFVALGSACGGALRYAISLLPFRGAFPLLTLTVNLLGAIAIGFIAGTAVSRGMPDNVQLFLKTGFCGGFTTFSTFSLEAWTLIELHHLGLGLLYIFLSVSLCIGGIVLGRALAA